MRLTFNRPRSDPGGSVMAVSTQSCWSNIARGSLAAIKQLCEGAPERSLEDHMAFEKALLEQNARGADAREGIAAFIARRAPKFGRS